MEEVEYLEDELLELSDSIIKENSEAYKELAEKETICEI